ncbi:uncharacterized protein LOC110933713 [Helianthus annuus]|uniref:uncharacterized protein LOC110933713 n=1 Tax=Helianthus annuus TaxID=4232 RepID=UPI000B8FC757|nr:uncharacterized protein LOC110933713 [Helianthus annuus]
MPKYSKFMRDFLTHKWKIESIQQVTLSEECSVAILNKLPQKKIDPGSFTIPCSIGGSPLSNALADLGASINLMSGSMFNRLRFGKPHPTKMSIQLADRTTWKKTRNPAHIRKTFLATARAMVDMSNRRLTMRVGDKEIKFEVGQRAEDDPIKYIKAIDSSLDDALQRYNLGCESSHSGNI